MRSHDEYNTTIYGLDDRYRGVKGGRRVLFINPEDISALGYANANGDRVDLISEWAGPDGMIQERRTENFRLVPYPTPLGNVAAYYPETSPLIPLDHVARTSNTPVSKAITIRPRSAHLMGRSRATRSRITRITETVCRSGPDTVVVEEPLEMRINGAPLAVTMRTPGFDVELAQGFLFTAAGLLPRRGSCWPCGRMSGDTMPSTSCSVGR
jgi:hypothetical protein